MARIGGVVQQSEAVDRRTVTLLRILLAGAALIVTFIDPSEPQRFVEVSYGLLVILGLIPATSTLFGLVPIYGYGVWLHLALGAIAAYFGFMGPAEVSQRS